MSAAPDPNSTLKSVTEFAAQIDLPSVQSPMFPKWYDARKRISDLVWEVHSANAYSHYRATKRADKPPLIASTGLFDQGRLHPGDAEALRNLFFDCPVIPFSADDFQPGYNFDPTGSLGNVNTYRRMTPAFEAKLTEVLAQIAPKVEEVCGHYFRIVSSHIWSLNPGPRKYQWHLDGWPVALKKLFIFPAGAGELEGSTAFRLKTREEKVVEGPPGTWMIFENSAIEHKGVESLKEARPSIAISIAPSFRTDLSLFDAGVNSGFPWFPLEGANGSGGPDSDYLSPASVNRRMLKAALESAGFGDLLTADGMVRTPAAVAQDPQRSPAGGASRSLKQRLRAIINRVLD